MKFEKRFSTITEVLSENRNYSETLLFDYESYLSNHKFISLHEFIKKWNIIINYEFCKIQINDIVFDRYGQRYMCLTSPWETESDDGMIYNIAEFVAVDDYNLPVSKTNMYLYAGSVYSKKIYHDDAYNDVIKYKGDGNICPILITKKHQSQN